MISIQELRIGNFILADGVIKKISLIVSGHASENTTGIGFESDEEACRFEHNNSSKLSAVPLDDKILQEFGFCFHPHFKLWQRVKQQNSYTIELDRDYTALDFSHRPIVKNIKHLHTLQNLFYTVQGEEIEKISSMANESPSITIQ